MMSERCPAFEVATEGATAQNVMGDPTFARPWRRRCDPRSLRAVSDEERQQFAVLPVEGEMDGIDLALLDPADENERRLLIEAEHPELRRALKEGRREIRIGRDIINPVLHIAMHEIVANQLWADDPPEVWRPPNALSPRAMSATKCCTCSPRWSPARCSRSCATSSLTTSNEFDRPSQPCPASGSSVAPNCPLNGIRTAQTAERPHADTASNHNRALRDQRHEPAIGDGQNPPTDRRSETPGTIEV
jgi:hypothetical protein